MAPNQTALFSECPHCGVSISVELKTAPKSKLDALQPKESRGRATYQPSADSSLALSLPPRITKPESSRRRDLNHTRGSKRKRSPSPSPPRATDTNLELSPLKKKKVASEDFLSSSPSPSSTIPRSSDLISRFVSAAEPTFTLSKPLPKGLKFKKDKTGSKVSQH